MSSAWSVADALTSNTLESLLQGEVAAISVPGFAPRVVVDALRAFIDASSLEPYPYYATATEGDSFEFMGVERVGYTYNESYIDCRKRNEYYARAGTGIHAVRKACGDRLGPIDALRLLLDEVWAPGAGLARFDGKPTFAGVCRVVAAECSQLFGAQPHFDMIPRSIVALDAQLSANVYLELPDTGGELELWPQVALGEAEVAALSGAVDIRSRLPAPFLVKPEIGDLLLFDTRRPHAVRPFPKGRRCSIQAFVGVEASSRRLLVWS